MPGRHKFWLAEHNGKGSGPSKQSELEELMEFLSQKKVMVKGPREIGNEEQGKTNRKRQK